MVNYLPSKDADEVRDYRIDWSPALNGDIIATSTWIVPPGINGFSASHDDSWTTIWIGGGTDGQNYDLTQTVRTLIGRLFKRRWRLSVRSR